MRPLLIVRRDHLESLHGRIALLAADRDAALAQVAELSGFLDHLRQEADEATAQMQRILQQPMAEAGARIQRILQLVAEEAAEVKAHAEAVDLRRGHYELGIDLDPRHRLAAAFAELAIAI